jgi:hypothetical protein
MKQRRLRAQPAALGADLERELDLLAREYKGLIDGTRIDWLSKRLQASDIAVRRSRSNFRGDRVSLVLDDGSTLKLNVARPEWRRFAALTSISRRDAQSWTVCGRSERGEPLTCDAWQASVTMGR